MPRWFSSGRQCPLSVEQQEWIDRRWDWLCSQFGNTFPRDRPIILPTPEFFPDTSTETPTGIESLFQCVCRYMNIDPGTVKLSLFDAPEVPTSSGSTADGFYTQVASGRFSIAIAAQTLANPFHFVGTVAHELAHVHLLGHKRLTGDTEDHELVTDLLPIFFGVGIFGANSVIYEKSWNDGQLGYWVAGKRGYMNMAMHSYALAKLAHLRGETRPAWAKHLRPDVRAEFREFSRVLAGHSVISEDPEDEESRPSVAASSEEVQEDLWEGGWPMPPEELLARYAAGDRDFRGIDFAESALSGVDLRDCDFSDCDFSRALLNRVNLSGSRMVGTNLRGALLWNANLTGCNLREANLSGADLSDADLSRSDLRATDFRGATLTGTNFAKTQRNSTTEFLWADVSEAVGAPELVAEARRCQEKAEGLSPSQRFFNVLIFTIFVTMFTAVLFLFFATQVGIQGQARNIGSAIVAVLVVVNQIVKRRWR